MDVTQAILQRRSIRAYLPKPIPQNLIEEILDVARWSPSATNTQAWSITTVSGRALAGLGEALVEANKVDHVGHGELPYPAMTQEMRERQRGVGYKVYAAKGIAREDTKKRVWWAQEGLRFFGAPVALVIHTPRSLTPYVLQDMGIIAMSIMLLAAERGLGSCPMEFPVRYPEVLWDQVGIPGDHMNVLTLALGYPDMADPVNNFTRDREPLSKFARFVE